MKRLILFELRKIFSKRLTQLAFAAVLLMSTLFAITTYQNQYAYDSEAGEGTGRKAVEIEKAVAARYSGVLTDEKVHRMISEIVPKTREGELNVRYTYQNYMQAATAAGFSNSRGYWNGLSVADVFGDDEIKIGYAGGWLSTSQNLIRVLIFLELFIMVMLAPVFCGEYGGVDNIILSSRYGKTKCGSAKAIAAIFASLLVTAVVLLLNFSMAAVLYGSEGLDCSILFAPLTDIEGGIPFNITCGRMLIYQVLLAFTGSISVTGITLILSAACKNQMIALVTSAAVYALPVMLPVSETSSLFRIIALLPIYHAQFISLMSIEQLGNGALYAIRAVPVATAFIVTGVVISRRIFARHQVS